ncbi:GNAT family N-acetyltransferase [Mycobacterium asiaticum]|uniref:GNAT family N-acetyltransferase n=1 Tax=Mycobacterium asiaticum TaxID=1790 RepID=UPI0020A5F322|nr:GNAT family N-acetyltransferase [Mycobacterium asiaticum]
MAKATRANPPGLLYRRATPEHDGFAGFPGTFSLRSLDLDRDLDLIHCWMNDPEVARYWKKPWSRDRIASYLRDQQLSTHSTPYIGELNGIAMSYWELYRADLDELAKYYEARAHDIGIHMLLGPAEYRGRKLAVDLLRVISSWQLDADPLATRIVGEPDATNVRLIRAGELAGFRRLMDIELPTKRAALMVRERD